MLSTLPSPRRLIHPQQCMVASATVHILPSAGHVGGASPMLFSVLCGAMRMLLERFLYRIERGERLSDFKKINKNKKNLFHCFPPSVGHVALLPGSLIWSCAVSLPLGLPPPPLTYSLLLFLSATGFLLLSSLKLVSLTQSLPLSIYTTFSVYPGTTQMAEGQMLICVLIREKFHCLTHIYV